MAGVKRRREKKEQEMIARAVRELGIDVPVMAARMVGKRLELYLLGGKVISWVPVATVNNKQEEDA